MLLRRNDEGVSFICCYCCCFVFRCVLTHDLHERVVLHFLFRLPTLPISSHITTNRLSFASVLFSVSLGVFILRCLQQSKLPKMVVVKLLSRPLKILPMRPWLSWKNPKKTTKKMKTRMAKRTWQKLRPKNICNERHYSYWRKWIPIRCVPGKVLLHVMGCHRLSFFNALLLSANPWLMYSQNSTSRSLYYSIFNNKQQQIMMHPLLHPYHYNCSVRLTRPFIPFTVFGWPSLQSLPCNLLAQSTWPFRLPSSSIVPATVSWRLHCKLPFRMNTISGFLWYYV